MMDYPYTPNLTSPKYRPRRWFGPDDYIEGDDPAIEIEKQDERIRLWDKAWSALPWYVRLWRTIKDN